jgi:hypothetical protein
MALPINIEDLINRRTEARDMAANRFLFGEAV